jgi:hypothetical protein
VFSLARSFLSTPSERRIDMAVTTAGRRHTGEPDTKDGGGRAAARQPVERLGNRLRGRVSQELNAQKDRVTQAIDDVASRVRRVGEPFEDEPYAPLSDYAQGAASRLEQLASDLRSRDVGELALQVGEFARKRPAAFVGASLAAGILAARFLKSSAEEPRSGERGHARRTGAQGRTRHNGD